MASADPSERAAADASAGVDHPYLSVLYKRLRSHRKKLEKIRGLEAAQAAGGKRLNAQQLELMAGKASLEKLVVELEMLREQFVAVYSQELAQKQQEAEDSAEQQQEEQQPQMEAVEEQQPQEEQAQAQEQQQHKDEFADVLELLKTLHVVNLHQALGKEVPMVLDFFSKVLLGNTRPPAELSYEENLMESLEEAKKYLANSDKEFACETTYSGLRAFVDQLATISSGKTAELVEEEEAAEEEVVAVEEVLDVPVVPAEINTMPEISFFAESQLESKQVDEAEERGPSKVLETHVELSETVATESQVEGSEGNAADEVKEYVEVAVEAAPAPESAPAPPLSFASVAAGVSSERTPSPSGSSDTSVTEKKEDGSGENSPRAKNSQRRRGQGRRWKEKGEKSSNSNNGDKPADGSPTNGAKPRRSRAPRTNDEIGSAQGKNNRPKEGRRPRADRGLRKQGSQSHQQTAPMIAPHA
ncbi:unnamed protein product [Phytophthora fragariaefolia]|uniref:Unnamed protein product n=1 Tax=Phytophthora fragariaefolia TaxID=1490495 RepID=A0A9W7D1W9_9STRA|nr:unnamed protein product [Phytophthora fragariaefolia]